MISNRDPILREAIKKGMEILSEEFVSGVDIEKLWMLLTKTLCSFDMLGEAARTQSDVDFFYDAYRMHSEIGEKCFCYQIHSMKYL